MLSIYCPYTVHILSIYDYRSSATHHHLQPSSRHFKRCGQGSGCDSLRARGDRRLGLLGLGEALASEGMGTMPWPVMTENGTGNGHHTYHTNPYATYKNDDWGMVSLWHWILATLYNIIHVFDVTLSCLAQGRCRRLGGLGGGNGVRGAEASSRAGEAETERGPELGKSRWSFGDQTWQGKIHMLSMK